MCQTEEPILFKNSVFGFSCLSIYLANFCPIRVELNVPLCATISHVSPKMGENKEIL